MFSCVRAAKPAPGIHADQADSFLIDAGDDLEAAIGHKAMDEIEYEALTVRANPDEMPQSDDDLDTDDLPLLTNEELMPLVFLVTGQWGPPESKYMARKPKVHLKVVHNPDRKSARKPGHGGKWHYGHGDDPVTFFDRMRLILDEIMRLRGIIAEREQVEEAAIDTQREKAETALKRAKESAAKRYQEAEDLLGSADSKHGAARDKLIARAKKLHEAADKSVATAERKARRIVDLEARLRKFRGGSEIFVGGKATGRFKKSGLGAGYKAAFRLFEDAVAFILGQEDDAHAGRKCCVLAEVPLTRKRGGNIEARQVDDNVLFRQRVARAWGKLELSDEQLVKMKEGLRQQPHMRSHDVVPLGVEWSVVAAKGNKKLPFASYSELPMATCPGAGSCGVYPKPPVRDGAKTPKTGHCYSVKAWRNMTAFSIQFLNTLAHYADREFAILYANGGKDIPLENYWDRFYATQTPEGLDSRCWEQYVKGCMFREIEAALLMGKRAFCRLFVDGDINHEDSILAWMDACRDIGRGGRDIKDMASMTGLEHVIEDVDGTTLVPGTRLEHAEVYGYTKCWSQFVNVDKMYRGVQLWPSNYTVNMSSHSKYQGYDEIREAMIDLPITRGYFEAIPLDRYIEKLGDIYRGAFRPHARGRGKHALNVFQGTTSKVMAKDGPFLRGNEIILFGRINDALRTVSAEAKADAEVAREGRYSILPPPDAALTDEQKKEVSRLLANEREALRPFMSKAAMLIKEMGGAHDWSLVWPEEGSIADWVKAVRKQVYKVFLTHILNREEAAAYVKRQLREDQGAVGDGDEAEKKYLKAVHEASRQSISKLLARTPSMKQEDAIKAKAYSEHRLHQKALALALHDVFQAVEIGGSCPLVCGNCSDGDGVHRCASKGLYKGKVIHIGLH